MIVFYADAGFELNLTNINIKFIEESTFFYNSFYRNYTPPFVLPLDNDFSRKLGLIDMDNIDAYETKHTGKLFIDTDFYEAFLLIEVENEFIEGTLYYGRDNLAVLEKPLKELPFPTINTFGLNSLINSYITKSWPEVPCNFPMVYDDEQKDKTNYETFLGIVNNRQNGNLVVNTQDIMGNINNRNIVSPFVYILEILKVGFASENRAITGSFVNRKENAHLLLDTKEHLERFSSDTSEDIQFNQHTDQFLDDNVLISEFKHQNVITSVGSYNIEVSINLPSNIKVRSFQILKDTTVIFESSKNGIQENIKVNKEEALGSFNLFYVLQLEGDVNNIADYNIITFEKTEGKLNIFKNIFSLSEVMPDMTFAGFLELLKNWLNIKFEIRNNYVVIDYVEELFSTLDFTDETHLEVLTPKREFNQNKHYKLYYSNPYKEVIVNKNGLALSTDEVNEKNLIEIDTKVSVYPIEEREGIFTSVRNNDANFGILLYNGLDDNGNAVVASAVDGISFSLTEVYNRYWKKWLYFRLNSESYTDKFTAHALEHFSTLVGRFKYNKKHIIKKITKQRVTEEDFLYEIESETL